MRVPSIEERKLAKIFPLSIVLSAARISAASIDGTGLQLSNEQRHDLQIRPFDADWSASENTVIDRLCVSRSVQREKKCTSRGLSCLEAAKLGSDSL